MHLIILISLKTKIHLLVIFVLEEFLFRVDYLDFGGGFGFVHLIKRKVIIIPKEVTQIIILLLYLLSISILDSYIFVNVAVCDHCVVVNHGAGERVGVLTYRRLIIRNITAVLIC